MVVQSLFLQLSAAPMWCTAFSRAHAVRTAFYLPILYSGQIINKVPLVASLGKRTREGGGGGESSHLESPGMIPIPNVRRGGR